MIVGTAGGLTSAGLGAGTAGGHVGISSAGGLEMMGHILSGGTPSGSTVAWSGRTSDVLIDAKGQAFIGGNTTDDVGNPIQVGGYIQAGSAITVDGGTDSSGTGVLIQAASELTTHDAAGSIVIHSDTDADIQGLLLPGGQVVNVYDVPGHYLGRQLQNFGGDSTIRVEAGNQVRVGTQLRAGKGIDLVGGTDSTGTSISLLGSASLATWAANSHINLNGPGRVDILAPVRTQEAGAAGWPVTADGKLTADVTLDVTVDKGDFTYHGSVTIPASATATNTSVGDLVADVQNALSTYSGYTVTRSSNAGHAVGSVYTGFAQDAANPDLFVGLRDGRILFSGPYAFQLGSASVNAAALGLTNLTTTLSSGTVYAVSATATGSTVSIGSPAGPNQKLYIAGKVLAYSAIYLHSGTSPDGVDIDLEYTGVLETVAGSISFDAGANGDLKGSVLARHRLRRDHQLGRQPDGARHHRGRPPHRPVGGDGRGAGGGEHPDDRREPDAHPRTGGQILVTGLNDVLIDSHVGEGSTGLTLVQIASTQGTTVIEHDSGVVRAVRADRPPGRQRPHRRHRREHRPDAGRLRRGREHHRHRHHHGQPEGGRLDPRRRARRHRHLRHHRAGHRGGRATPAVVGRHDPHRQDRQQHRHQPPARRGAVGPVGGRHHDDGPRRYRGGRQRPDEFGQQHHHHQQRRPEPRGGDLRRGHARRPDADLDGAVGRGADHLRRAGDARRVQR